MPGRLSNLRALFTLHIEGVVVLLGGEVALSQKKNSMREVS